MWLINVKTLTPEHFYGDAAPPYAILSHTWGKDELTFQDLGVFDKTWVSHKSGYRKLINLCEEAQKDGFLYVWIDTCCIDKTNNAELTEAINSMFDWYRQSQVCYAHLGDVELGHNIGGDPVAYMEQLRNPLYHCRWFKRGWCLQELLAPPCLRFYNKQWMMIGERGALAHIISDITGVPETALVSPPQKHIHDFPVAARISWMARRQTTRPEDMSYSLLGILDINMPMLYGEGHQAFQRLQEEVIRKYNDLSILAWRSPKKLASEGFLPALAPLPSSFARDHGQSGPQDDHDGQDTTHLGHRVNTQFSLTNQGLVFPLAKLYSQHAKPPFRHQYVLYLNHHDASFRGSIIDHKWYILLQKVGPGLFVRLQETRDRIAAFRKRPIIDPCSEPVCILNQLPTPLTRQLAMWERHAIRLRWRSWAHQRQKFWHVRAVEPQSNWDRVGGQFLVEMATEQYMHIEFAPGEYRTNPDMEYFVIVIRVGDGKRRNTRRVSAHIVSGKIWPGVNATPFRFAFKENLAIRALEGAIGDGVEGKESNFISMVGYNITMSVEVVEQERGEPYHSIYLDWVRSEPGLDKQGGKNKTDLVSRPGHVDGAA